MSSRPRLPLVEGRPQSAHPLYGTYRHMLERCYVEKARAYRWYGARGIRVCDRWRASMAAFVADMGPKPTPGHEVDRRDSSGHYEPSNCRWATRHLNALNQRRQRTIGASFRAANAACVLWPTAEQFNDPFITAAADALADMCEAFGRLSEWDVDLPYGVSFATAFHGF